MKRSFLCRPALRRDFCFLTFQFTPWKYGAPVSLKTVLPVMRRGFCSKIFHFAPQKYGAPEIQRTVYRQFLRTPSIHLLGGFFMKRSFLCRPALRRDFCFLTFQFAPWKYGAPVSLKTVHPVMRRGFCSKIFHFAP